MKRLAIVVIAVGVLGGAYLIKDTEDYTAPTEVIKEVEKEVETLDIRIQKALTASSTEIEAQAKRAYDEAKEQAELNIKTAVRDAYIAELTKENEVEKKKLDSY